MRKKVLGFMVLFGVAAIVMGLLAAAPALAAQPDAVLSGDIKEADGTTGQDTNTGSGIKTGHIQDGAVTAGKIADGAVTNAKITGPISASNINSTNLDADTVDGMHATDFAQSTHTHTQSDINGLVDALAGKSDISHNHDSIYQKKYANVIVVAQSDGDFTDLVSAMNSITDASASNPYLIKIMPGEYQITSNVVAKDYVDVEGSGVTVTRLVSTGAQFLIDNGVTSEFRNFTFEGDFTNLSGNQMLFLIRYSAPKLTDLNLRIAVNSATGHASGVKLLLSNIIIDNVNLEIASQSGLCPGIDAIQGSGSVDGSGKIVLNNVSVTVSGAQFASGIFIFYGDAALNNVNVRVSDGENWGIISGDVSGPQYNPKVMVRNSEVSAQTALLVTKVFDSGELMVANSKLEGLLENVNATLKLVNCFNGNYDPIPDGNY